MTMTQSCRSINLASGIQQYFKRPKYMKSLLHLLQCNQNGSKSPIFPFLECSILKCRARYKAQWKESMESCAACVKSVDELAQCLSKDT